MDFQNLFIRPRYISNSKSPLLNELINPAMKCAKIYRQSLSHMPQSFLDSFVAGLTELAKHKNEMRLLVLPEHIPFITDDCDVKKTIENSIHDKIYSLLSSLSDYDLGVTSEIVSCQYLKVEIGYSADNTPFINQVGIIEDSQDNSFVFYGGFNSLNESTYETVRVFRSWHGENTKLIDNEKKEFDLVWDHNSDKLLTFCFNEQLSQIIKEIQLSRSIGNGSNVIQLRDYQQEAISAWINNNYHGFYVMATGTGKTWTSIFAAKELLKSHKAMVVICAPYKHLLKQWMEDIVKVFPSTKPILVSSENPSWPQQLKTEILHNVYDKKRQIIVISTISSFWTERFHSIVNISDQDKLLIVDEAHRFTQLQESLKNEYKYMLGLSATPFSGKSAEKGKLLMSFFGGRVYNLPIDEALKRNHLVRYSYHPIFVHSSQEEEQAFSKQTQIILSCFNNHGVCINPDLLTKALRARLRVISMVEEKLTALDRFIEQGNQRDHFIVYCGDGRYINDDGSEIRHIQTVKKMLSSYGYRVSQFTAEENMQQRMDLINAFNKGDISALAAIRCLDEGINIPSITSAIILSSNDDYREFVQRRGRILRKYKDKDHADIYDMIVLPSKNTPGIANIEFRRFAEYARLAQNQSELESELNHLLAEYELTREDISKFDYEDQEDTLDE